MNFDSPNLSFLNGLFFLSFSRRAHIYMLFTPFVLYACVPSMQTSKKPPKDRGQPKAFTDAMRGRGSSMDDVTGDSSSEANAGASSESATGGAAAAVEDEY